MLAHVNGFAAKFRTEFSSSNETLSIVISHGFGDSSLKRPKPSVYLVMQGYIFISNTHQR